MVERDYDRTVMTEKNHLLSVYPDGLPEEFLADCSINGASKSLEPRQFDIPLGDDRVMVIEKDGQVWAWIKRVDYLCLKSVIEDTGVADISFGYICGTISPFGRFAGGMSHTVKKGYELWVQAKKNNHV